MYIARILYPVNVLGPGKRIGIWFDGCQHHCQGCSNPELWDQSDRYFITETALTKLIRGIIQENQVDGFTLTGGDPFEQSDALGTLLIELKKYTRDILVYTGYQYAEVMRRYPNIVDNIGVLIDGEYIEALNHNLILRGSSNQNIIVIDDMLKEKYDKYLKEANNEIQNFTSSDGIISVGIHRPGYAEEIDLLLREKGLNPL